jgi:hypothetical protein
MRDPWKYVAFPLAGITGYLVSLGVRTVSLGSQLGIPDIIANIIVIGLAGLFSGFLIDDLIPAYLEKVRGGSDKGDFGSGGDEDFGGDSGGDFSFD